MNEFLIEITEETRQNQQLLDFETLHQEPVALEDLKEVLAIVVDRDDLQIYQHEWLVEIENEKSLQLINRYSKIVEDSLEKIHLVVKISLPSKETAFLIRETLGSLLK